MDLHLDLITDVGPDPAAAAIAWLAAGDRTDVRDARAAGRSISYTWSLNRGLDNRAASGHLVIMAEWTGGFSVVGRWAWTPDALETGSRIAYALKARGRVLGSGVLHPTEIARSHAATPAWEDAWALHRPRGLTTLTEPGDSTPRFQYGCWGCAWDSMWHVTADEARDEHKAHRAREASTAADAISSRWPTTSHVAQAV